MKITSAILTTMSGKLGGAVGAKARGGIQYLRKLVIPHNPKTANQSFIRSALSGLAAAWTATLTDIQRSLWTDLARDQESGIDVYVGQNTMVLRAGLTRQDSAPPSRSAAFSNTPGINSGTYIIDSGAANITIANGKKAMANTGKLLVFASSSDQPSSRLAQQHPFTFIESIVQDETTNAPTIDLNSFLSRHWTEGGGPGSRVGYVKLVGVNADASVTDDLIIKLSSDEA